MDKKTHAHTYIGNDRKLADSTENVVPYSWRWHAQERKERRNKVAGGVEDNLCADGCVENTDRDTNGGTVKGGKKVIKSSWRVREAAMPLCTYVRTRRVYSVYLCLYT